LWNTPVDSPFETSAWKPVNSAEEIRGFWTGSISTTIPADKNTGNPEFNIQFTMTLKNNNNLFDIGFRMDMDNYLESLIAAYPSHNFTKDQFWSTFVNNSKKKNSAFEFGEYYFQMYHTEITLENIFQEDCSLYISSVGTRLKAIIPKDVFGLSSAVGPDSMELLLINDNFP
jgi:hypothetical protein